MNALQEPIPCIFYFMIHPIMIKSKKCPKIANVSKNLQKIQQNAKNKHLDKTHDMIKQFFAKKKRIIFFFVLSFSSHLQREGNSGDGKKILVVVYELQYNTCQNFVSVR